MRRGPLNVLKVMLVVALLVFGAYLLLPKDGTENQGSGPGALVPVFDNVWCPKGEDQCNLEITDPMGPANEVTIALNPKDPNNLIAGGKDYTPGPGDCVWAGYYWTTDGGLTWGNAPMPGYPGDSNDTVLTGYACSSDPVVAYDGDGNAYYSGLAYTKGGPVIKPQERRVLGSSIWLAKSTDKGATYDEIYIVAESAGLRIFHDKQWFDIDPDNGYIYMTWTKFRAGQGQIVHSRSTDGGRTWSRAFPISAILYISAQNQGSMPAVGPDGELFVTWINFDRDKLMFTKSMDNGASFDQPREIADVTPLPRSLPNSEFRTPTMPTMSVDTSDGPERGSIYIVWNDYVTGNSEVLLVKSSDGGSSFTSPLKVNDNPVDDGTDQFFPTIDVGPMGDVHVAFYDRRDDPENYLLRMTYAHSLNGTAFDPNLNISDVIFDSKYSLHQTGSIFIGDYLDIASSSDKVYPIWADTRKEEADAFTTIITRSKNTDPFTAP